MDAFPRLRKRRGSGLSPPGNVADILLGEDSRRCDNDTPVPAEAILPTVSLAPPLSWCRGSLRSGVVDRFARRLRRRHKRGPRARVATQSRAFLSSSQHRSWCNLLDPDGPGPFQLPLHGSYPALQLGGNFFVRVALHLQDGDLAEAIVIEEVEEPLAFFRHFGGELR